MMTADRSLCLTADKSRVVEHGDLEADTLLVFVGAEIDDAAVKRYGLRLVDGKIRIRGAAPLEEVATEAPISVAPPAPEPPVAKPAKEEKGTTAPAKPKGRARKRG